MAETQEPSNPGGAPDGVILDDAGRVRVPRGAAIMAALLRIGLGLLYLWGFVSQAFGILFANEKTTAAGEHVSWGWYFSYTPSHGWISSGFAHSPTAGFISGTHGPVAPIIQHLPTGVDDFGWMFAIGGLGIALTLGIFMKIAGWGGLLLNLMIWLSLFPPSSNPVIDGEHMAFAFSILLLMFLHAGNYWGLGRWWCRHTPRWMH